MSKFESMLKNARRALDSYERRTSKSERVALVTLASAQSVERFAEQALRSARSRASDRRVECILSSEIL